MKINNLEPLPDGSWQCGFSSPDGLYDYHIRKENEKYVVDSFDSCEDDNDKAHVGTDEFDSFEQAIGFNR